VETFRAVTLMAATLSMGLVAGVFGLYWHTIMPGLARTDDRTFVGAFQALDRAIINPWFMAGGFLGAVVEARWARVNRVRVLLSTVAFGLLAWALVVHGGT
jgi:uncharacterized membrane protein